MLTIKIQNDATGTNENASYHYRVFVNGKEIERGDVNGHNRSDGWPVLLKKIVEDSVEKTRGEYKC